MYAACCSPVDAEVDTHATADGDDIHYVVSVLVSA